MVALPDIRKKNTKVLAAAGSIREENCTFSEEELYMINKSDHNLLKRTLICDPLINVPL